jgi:glycosyltransferase involved in cell wall biosynthesis
LAATLPKHPDWKAIFILSAVEENKEYVASFQPALDVLGQQAEVLTQQRFPVVKGWLEKGAIAIIPSIWKEPFGRTALEAHAGGAAVISSGAGGLREVSGDNALYLDGVTPESIAAATEQLLTDANKCQNLAAAGHNYVRQRFDIHTTARACDQIYERLIAQKLTRTSS